MCIRFPFFADLPQSYKGYYMTLQREGGAAAGSGTADITGLSDISAEMKMTGFGTHSRDLSQLMAAGPFDTSSFCDPVKEIINSDVVSSVENSYITYIIMFIRQQWICACLLA